MSSRNIKLLIEYDGTDFSGWQTQPHKRTVQKTIEEVLTRILGEQVSVRGASRTDAGVHALGQVAHFKTGKSLPCERIKAALNGLLPPDISIRKVTEEKPSFHANRSAKKKTYVYRIWNARERSALMRHRAWHVWTPLDVAAMKKAVRHLMGGHDFSAFRAAKSDTKTSVRRMDTINVRRGAIDGAPALTSCLQITFTANGFLKHMIRNIVGTLVEVGEGRRSPENVKAVLKSKDRRKAGKTAPAQGLHLLSVDY